MSFPLLPDWGYALLSVISFTFASFLFRVMVREAGPVWTNAFKATVAASIFAGVFVVSGMELPPVLAGTSIAFLMISGFLGLNLSDYLMLQAYHRIGPARTMIIYRSQPLYLGLLAYLFLGQALQVQHVGAILLFILCVGILAYEKRRIDGHWDKVGLGLAVGGMLLDGTGIFLTRMGFEMSPGLGSQLANLIRATGALIGFFLISKIFAPIELVGKFRGLSPRLKGLAFLGAMMGSYIGLSLWLKAIQFGQVARVTSVAGVAPMLALGIESGLARRWPSRYAWTALALSMVAFYLLTRE